MSLNHLCPNCGNPHLEIELAGCTKRLDVHGLWVDADDLTQDELKEVIEQPNTPVSCPRCQWDGFWGELVDTKAQKLDGFQYDMNTDDDAALPVFGVERNVSVDLLPGMLIKMQDNLIQRTMEYRVHQIIPIRGVWQKEDGTLVTGVMPHFVCVVTNDSTVTNPVIVVSSNRIKEEVMCGTWALLPKPVKETTPIEDATRDTLLQQEIEYLRQHRPQFSDGDDVSMEDAFPHEEDHDD